jgi:hypothetical protein
LPTDHGETKRVELNALASDEFVAFIERKLTEAGVKKVVPSDAVIERHMRRLIEQRLADAEIEKRKPEFAVQAAKARLPRNPKAPSSAG